MTLPSVWPPGVVVVELLAHASAGPTPVPHSVVLVVGVLGLWVLVGGGVVVVDGLLARFVEK